MSWYSEDSWNRIFSISRDTLYPAHIGSSSRNHLPSTRESDILHASALRCTISKLFLLVGWVFCFLQERDEECWCFSRTSVVRLRVMDFINQSWLAPNFMQRSALTFLDAFSLTDPTDVLANDRAKLCDSRLWDAESDSVGKRLQHE